MNQQDKSFLVTFTGVMTVLVLLAVAIFLISRGVTVLDTVPDDGKRRAATALDRIRPVGTVAMAAPVVAGAEAAEPKSGAEVVAAVCSSCHQAGVLNAPKIGDKAGWEARLAQGLDTLVNNAINGLNAMPPKGGNPNLSEQEIRNATTQMLADSGLEAGDSGAAAPAQDQQAAAGGADLAKGKEVYNGICAACHQAGVLNAPKVGDKAVWEARLAQGLDTLVNNAVNGLNAMPPKGGNPALSDDDIHNAVAYMVSESGVSMAAAPAAEAAPATAAAPAAAAIAGAVGADLATIVQAAAEAAKQAAEAAKQAAQAAQEAAAAAKQAVGGQKDAAAKPAAEGESQTAAPAAEQAAPAPEQAAPAPEQAAPAPEQAAPASEQAAPASEQAAPEPTAPAPEQAAPAPAAPAQAEAQQQPAPAGLPADLDLAQGKQLYNTACIICHQQGVANAPKLGDKEAWGPRLEQGFDTLVSHAIDGYKGMPPKGGKMDAPDEDIRAAVGYMAHESQ